MPVLGNVSRLATCREGGGQAEIHVLAGAALAWHDDTIRWVGPESDLPAEFRGEPRWDAGGKLVIPGLVDCHTHLGFGGWRPGEFEQRCLGRSYLEIAQSGGGIASTVRATRQTSREELVERCLRFLAGMSRLGVTTVEAKSGYALERDGEIRQLEAYRQAARRQPVRLVSTFLAHMVAPEYGDRRAEYVQLLKREIIPEVSREGLADFCDVFVEDSAFTLQEARELLEAGKSNGLAPKLHADQLSDGNGAALAVELEAASADHLEHVSKDNVSRLGRSRVVAVSLPLATFYLGQPPLPARELIEAGVPVAVATDFNPGSAPSYHLPLAMMMACTLQRMSPAEVLKGATIYAARAIGRQHSVGSLEEGKAADFAIIDAPDVNQWLYHFRANACVRTVIGGRTVHQRDSCP